MLEIKIKTCEVGMFRLPGVTVEPSEDCNEQQWQSLQEEMDAWIKSEQGTGRRMTDKLWSFKNESQRDWFILRWSE